MLYKAKRKIEYCKAQTRAKVEHPFRVIKRQFGYVKVRFRGLMKNTAQLTTLFALSNLWVVRKQLMGMGELRAKDGNPGERPSIHEASAAFWQIAVRAREFFRLAAAVRQVDRSILSPHQLYSQGSNSVRFLTTICCASGRGSIFVGSI